MKNEFKHDLTLAMPPDHGKSAPERARAMVAEHAEARAAEHRERAEQMAAIHDEQRRALAEVFGDKSEAYRKECASWRAANKLGAPDPNAPITEVMVKRIARYRAEGQAALQRLGIDAERIHKIGARAGARLDALQLSSRADIPKMALVPEGKEATEARTGKSGWVVRTPPYDGVSWWSSASHRGGSAPILEGYLDGATGDVGHRSAWTVNSSEDNDLLLVEQANNVCLWVWADAPGPVEIALQVRCAVTRSYMCLFEEFWEWSSAYVSHRDFLSVNVSPSNADADLSPTWSSKHTQGEDGYGHDLYPVPSNGTYEISMVTRQPVPGGDWTLLEVGSRGSHSATINDTRTGLTLQSRWFIEKIGYRIR